MPHILTYVLVHVLVFPISSSIVDPSWPPILFPRSEFVANCTVYEVDLQSLDVDTKLAAATLQGAINAAGHPEVYLLLAPWDTYWLNVFRASGKICPRVSYQAQPAAAAEYFAAYRNAYNTIVVYDPKLPDTINVATCIAAAIQYAIVVAPVNASELGMGKTVIDLRERWTTPVEAYEYMYETYFRTGRLNESLIAYLHPTANQHHLRDYLIRHRVVHFYAHADDEDMQNFMKKILNESQPNNVPQDEYTSYYGVLAYVFFGSTHTKELGPVCTRKSCI
eukprot:m.308928 g.308928  ORF g.308928 m.308928 type:complete len:279 (+) comp20196_c0_seq8:148-984(+)